ncbi:hypothetical protein B0A52_07688 [Exophiala mesophila]|uniref:F-box domain-containing protein n=1 Tax=Exophiala mesophila TaxID=212818 RepID=A0A438MYI2_EXOME|nr:hypothetical protein B0A52_07688 [Exophiala mesophila]
MPHGSAVGQPIPQSQASDTNEQVTIIFPGERSKKTANGRKQAAPSVTSESVDSEVDLEPLVDTTAALTLTSKKTLRLKRRQEKKQSQKKAFSHDVHSFLDLPGDLLIAVLSYLKPSEIYLLLQLNHATRRFIQDNIFSITTQVMKRRYWVLKQCFPVPVALDSVPEFAQHAVLSQAWQDRLRIHKNPYQHVQAIDPQSVCTCMSCALAWNNLCIVLDLAHWQTNLENREPIPIIARGSTPEWNVKLLDDNARIVRLAMKSPLAHARILQTHLDTTTRAIIRSGRWRKKGEKTTTPRPRLYHLTDSEAADGYDTYLERSGPPSYEPIYMRDNYYSIEAFIPNRKWDKTEQVWKYYSKWPKPHEESLNWLVARFMPKS